MDPVLDITLNLYLIRLVVVLAVAAGVYFLRYDMIHHLFVVIVHGEEKWCSSDSMVVGEIIFAALFIFAPGMGDRFITEYLASFLGILTAFSMRMEMSGEE
jgi:hypothetical protein